MTWNWRCMKVAPNSKHTVVTTMKSDGQRVFVLGRWVKVHPPLRVGVNYMVQIATNPLERILAKHRDEFGHPWRVLVHEHQHSTIAFENHLGAQTLISCAFGNCDEDIDWLFTIIVQGNPSVTINHVPMLTIHNVWEHRVVQSVTVSFSTTKPPRRRSKTIPSFTSVYCWFITQHKRSHHWTPT